MKKFIKPFVLLFFLGCASAPPVQPDWVSGNSAKYASSRYLIGRGQAEMSAIARDRARSDLAKIFEVKVSEESKEILRQTSQTGEGEPIARFEAKISRNIVTRTDQIIRGVEIKETWQDTETKQHHALAVLDRLQAGNLLRTTITELDAETRNAIERAKAAPDLIIKIGAAQTALEAQMERDQYQRYLTILDRTGVGVPAEFSTRQLAGEFDSLLKRLKIKAAAPDDQIGGLEDIVEESLANAGFLPEKGEAAEYLLEAKIQTAEHTDKKGWSWLRGTLEVVMKIPESGKIRGSRRWDIKVSSQQKEMVLNRARDNISGILERDLRETIIGFGSPKKH